MHDGGPAAPTDPFPATPLPSTVRRATPDEAAAASTKPQHVVFLAAGLAVIVLFAVVGLKPGRSPLWASVGPPLLVFLAAIAASTLRNRRRAAAQAASERALTGGGTPVPVLLEPQWYGTASKVRNRLVVRHADAGTIAGFVRMVIKEDQFDPRGRMWLSGPAEAGAAVALVPGDDRRPLLTSAPFETSETTPPVPVHPCSAAINALLGWEGDRSMAPIGPGGARRSVPSSPLPPELAAVVRPMLRRQVRIGRSVLVAFWLFLWLCIALRPDLLVSIVLTAAVWGSWRALLTWGSGWLHQPVVQVLEGLGHSATDARFMAQALVRTRFGLALPPEPDQPAVPADAPPPAGAGWGYGPQPIGPPVAAPAPLRSGAPPMPPGSTIVAPAPPPREMWSSSTNADGSFPARSIGLAAGLALVVLGALVYVSTSASRTHSVEATVLESPTATGGVLLDVPLGGTFPGVDGVTVVQRQPWETHDLDPDGIEAGDTIDVEVDEGCFCNPSIPDDGPPRGQLLGLALVGLGVAVAIGSRFLRGLTAAPAGPREPMPVAAGPSWGAPPPPAGWGGPPRPPPSS